MACRIARTREWAVRITHEASYYDVNSFVTLTFSEDYLPPSGSLDKRYLQLFFKRMRKNLNEQIKYFACGEYGEVNKRPHYHAIIFGYWPEDAELHERTKNGPVFKSRSLSELWPYGFSTVANVEYESIAYVTGYIEKKLNGEKAKEEYIGLTPPFQIQSHGIGERWILDNEKWVRDNGGIRLRGKTVGIPRFYAKKVNLSDVLKKQEEERKENLSNSLKKMGYTSPEEQHFAEEDNAEYKKQQLEGYEKLFKRRKEL